MTFACVFFCQHQGNRCLDVNRTSKMNDDSTGINNAAPSEQHQERPFTSSTGAGTPPPRKASCQLPTCMHQLWFVAALRLHLMLLLMRSMLTMVRRIW
jgi:hypothetical protein